MLRFVSVGEWFALSVVLWVLRNKGRGEITPLGLILPEPAGTISAIYLLFDIIASCSLLLEILDDSFDCSSS